MLSQIVLFYVTCYIFSGMDPEIWAGGFQSKGVQPFCKRDNL